MESQYKAGINGTPVRDTHPIGVKVVNRRSVRSSDFLLRLLAIATTLAAAIVMGVSKETKTIPITLIPGTDPVYVSVPAKMRYSSGLVYFVVANAIGAAYSVFALVGSMAQGSAARGLGLFITIVDLIMVALLSTGLGSAAAVGVLGYKGNKHLAWDKVCNVYGTFCHHVLGAIIVALIGVNVYIFLVALSIVHLYRRSQ